MTKTEDAPNHFGSGFRCEYDFIVCFVCLFVCLAFKLWKRKICRRVHFTFFSSSSSASVSSSLHFGVPQNIRRGENGDETEEEMEHFMGFGGGRAGVRRETWVWMNDWMNGYLYITQRRRRHLTTVDYFVFMRVHTFRIFRTGSSPFTAYSGDSVVVDGAWDNYDGWLLLWIPETTRERKRWEWRNEMQRLTLMWT